MGKLYKILMIALTPLLKLYFYSRCLYGKDKMESVKNHFGIATIERPNGKLVWIHAASIGESLSALTYIKHLKNKHPDVNVLLTTITVTSADIVKPKIQNIPNVYHQFVVVDTPIWIRKFLNYWKPDMVIFLESEIWPNVVDMLHDRSVPVYILNAKLSSHSAEHWEYCKSFFTETLSKFKAILAQSKRDKERFELFSPDNVFQIDNLKYANAVLPCDTELLQLFKKLCEHKKVLVAASTHDEEEEIIIDAYTKLREQFDTVLFIIPRDIDRAQEICSLFENQKISYVLRSKMTPDTKADAVCVDSFGEVGTFFTLADVCFVGGSLVQVGGHNIYEPVAMGKPVLHGKYMDSALEVRDFLDGEKVAFEVENASDIVSICSRFFENEALLKDISDRSLKLTKNNALKQIDEIIEGNC